MMTTTTAIIKSLASGEKSRSQIVHELALSPPLVTGALVTMVNTGQVVVSGKTRINGKTVAVYGLPKQQPVPRETSHARLVSHQDTSVAELPDSTLYGVWGGYYPIDVQTSKNLDIRVHTER